MKFEDELKYVSIEANDSNDNGPPPPPRDSVEPRSTGRFRASDELHHGPMRLTDELRQGPMRLTDEIAYIKQERLTDELTHSNFRADSTDLPPQATSKPSIFCSHPICLDWYWQPSKFFTRKGDLTRHTEAYHGSATRPKCPADKCNYGDEAEELRQHFLATHLADEAGKRLSIRVKPVQGPYINYESKGFALLLAPPSNSQYWCELGCSSRESKDALHTDHDFRFHYNVFHYIEVLIVEDRRSLSKVDGVFESYGGQSHLLST